MKLIPKRTIALGLGVFMVSLLLGACGGGDATNTPLPTESDTTLPTATPDATETSSPTASGTDSPAAGLAWEKVSFSGPAPEARKDATIVYDEGSNALLLFGGRSGGQGLNDLWSFDLASEGWTEITAPGGPSSRWGHVAGFDSARGRLVVFSGQHSGGFLNDTWVFDTADNTWREVTSAGDAPSQRYGSCAAYDSKGDRFFISHGFTGEGRFDDTWAFDLDSERWADVSPDDVRPVVRCLHRCSFDSENDTLMLFGGQTNVKTPPILGDFWRYDPSIKTWEDISSQEGGPPPRYFSSLVGDPASQRFLLFGGASLGPRTNDLWSYGEADGWMELATSGTGPDPISNHSAVHVPTTGALYIFGGTTDEERGDLWKLVSS